MKKYIFLAIALLLLTAACSNDENSNPKELPKQAVQFSFTNEDFGADETLSRATGTAETKPQIVDLGDCEAEISVENEPAVKTRGPQTNANGHYTIRAYQGGTLKGEMKGTFSGGNFTPDASSRKSMNLSDGTYDFIAFNDDVTINGNELKVERTDVETARMGITTTTITATPAKQMVNFTMKHVGARLRTQFVCKKDIPENITATLEQTAANVIPTSVVYNPMTKAYTSTNGAMTAETCNSPASTENKYGASGYGRIYAYTSTSDYHYFLPTTEGSKLKLTFNAGTVFWKPLTGTLSQLNATLQMQANKSYVVKIKLKPLYTYLFHDGTTGFLKDKGTRTPVGIVIKPGLAVALNDANGGAKCMWDTNPATWNSQSNQTMYKTNFATGYNTYNGEEETWNPAYSYPTHQIKGDIPTYTAIYKAGHYGQLLTSKGIPVTGNLLNRWFLPSYGEWKEAITTLAFFNPSQTTNWAQYREMYGAIVSEAFTQVGGDDLFPNQMLLYWSSSEYDGFYAVILDTNTAYGIFRDWAKSNLHCYARAFVRY